MATVSDSVTRVEYDAPPEEARRAAGWERRARMTRVLEALFPLIPRAISTARRGVSSELLATLLKQEEAGLPRLVDSYELLVDWLESQMVRHDTEASQGLALESFGVLAVDVSADIWSTVHRESYDPSKNVREIATRLFRVMSSTPGEYAVVGWFQYPSEAALLVLDNREAP